MPRVVIVATSNRGGDKGRHQEMSSPPPPPHMNMMMHPGHPQYFPPSPYHSYPRHPPANAPEVTTPNNPPSSPNNNNDNPRKRKKTEGFTSEEDQILKRAVQGYYAKKEAHGKRFRAWESLAEKKFGGFRTGKQLHRRWNNCLNPEIDHSPFVLRDDMGLKEGYESLGPKWRKISEDHFEGRRCENELKNRFNRIMYKKLAAEGFSDEVYAKMARANAISGLATESDGEEEEDNTTQKECDGIGEDKEDVDSDEDISYSSEIDESAGSKQNASPVDMRGYFPNASMSPPNAPVGSNPFHYPFYQHATHANGYNYPPSSMQQQQPNNGNPAPDTSNRKKRQRNTFTEREDLIIENAVARAAEAGKLNPNWNTLSWEFRGKTPPVLKKRWDYLLAARRGSTHNLPPLTLWQGQQQPKNNNADQENANKQKHQKIKFTKEEDVIIEEAVAAAIASGEKKPDWSKLAKEKLPGKSALLVRLRWVSNLNQAHGDLPFSRYEDLLLKESYESLGPNNFREISKLYFNGKRNEFQLQIRHGSVKYKELASCGFSEGAYAEINQSSFTSSSSPSEELPDENDGMEEKKGSCSSKDAATGEDNHIDVQGSSNEDVLNDERHPPVLENSPSEKEDTKGVSKANEEEECEKKKLTEDGVVVEDNNVEVRGLFEEVTKKDTSPSPEVEDGASEKCGINKKGSPEARSDTNKSQCVTSRMHHGDSDDDMISSSEIDDGANSMQDDDIDNQYHQPWSKQQQQCHPDNGAAPGSSKENEGWQRIEFTKEEDLIIKVAVAAAIAAGKKKPNWSKLAREKFPGTSRSNIIRRWNDQQTGSVSVYHRSPLPMQHQLPNNSISSTSKRQRCTSTKEEDLIIGDAVEAAIMAGKTTPNWSKLARENFPGKTRNAVMKRWNDYHHPPLPMQHQLPNDGIASRSKRQRCTFTKEEDLIIEEAVAAAIAAGKQKPNWSKLAREKFPGKSRLFISRRWNEKQPSGVNIYHHPPLPMQHQLPNDGISKENKRGRIKFTKEEDLIIEEAVAAAIATGKKKPNWSKLARENFPENSARVIQIRWDLKLADQTNTSQNQPLLMQELQEQPNNSIDAPDSSNEKIEQIGTFTKEEDIIIEEAGAAVIASSKKKPDRSQPASEKLPGKSEEMVRLRWVSNLNLAHSDLPFSIYEDLMLREGYECLGPNNFREISKVFFNGKRNEFQLQTRYDCVQYKELASHGFSEEAYVEATESPFTSFKSQPKKLHCKKDGMEERKGNRPLEDAAVNKDKSEAKTRVKNDSDEKCSSKGWMGAYIGHTLTSLMHHSQHYFPPAMHQGHQFPQQPSHMHHGHAYPGPYQYLPNIHQQRHQPNSSALKANNINKKRQFTEKEDFIITATVESSGDRYFAGWDKLAEEKLWGWTEKQVRERWLTVLYPTRNILPFNKDEDLCLGEAYIRHGPNWGKIRDRYFKDKRWGQQLKERHYSWQYRKLASERFSEEAYAKLESDSSNEIAIESASKNIEKKEKGDTRAEEKGKASNKDNEGSAEHTTDNNNSTSEANSSDFGTMSNEDDGDTDLGLLESSVGNSTLTHNNKAPSKTIILTVSPGTLGLRLQTHHGEGAKIMSISRDSSLLGEVEIGDRIIAIGHHPVTRMTDLQVGRKQTRKFTIVRDSIGI